MVGTLLGTHRQEHLAPSSPDGCSHGARTSRFSYVRILAMEVSDRHDEDPTLLPRWAPTPTTKANLLGFRYPEPGKEGLELGDLT